MNKLLLLIRRYLSIPASATVTENYRFNVRTYKKRGNFSPLYSIEWFPFIKLESVQQMTNIYDDDLALFPKYSLNDLMTRKFVFICLYYNVYSKPCLSSEIDCFSKHGWPLNVSAKRSVLDTWQSIQKKTKTSLMFKLPSRHATSRVRPLKVP